MELYTTQQIQEIAAKVKEMLATESQGVGEIPIVKTLDLVYSLPALQRDGAMEKVVEAPLDLLQVFLQKTQDSVQWKQGKEGVWKTLVSLTEISGKSPEFRTGTQGIEWRYAEDVQGPWKLLVSYDTLKLKFEDLSDAQKEEIRGYSSFQLWQQEEGNQDKTYEDYKAYLKLEVTEAADQCMKAEADRVTEEGKRAKSEIERLAAEKLRGEHEGARETAEEARGNAEKVRDEHEGTREAAEKIRQGNETTRGTNEEDRVGKEKARVEAEDSRNQAEKARDAAEILRDGAEKDRGTKEEARQTAEGKRGTAEEARDKAETLRGEAEDKRGKAEKVRGDAEAERGNKERARQTAEETRGNNETDRQNKETERQTAEDNRVNAEGARDTAETDRQTHEETRVGNETKRVEAESKRVSEFGTLSQESKEATQKANEIVAMGANLPKIQDGTWWVFDTTTKAYVDSGAPATGKSPKIQNGTWWIWNDDTQKYVDSGQSVSSTYQLTKEKVENVLTGVIESHEHPTYSPIVYEALPDLKTLKTYTDKKGVVRQFIPGNDIYVKNDSEPTGYSNYKMAVSTTGNIWVQIPQIMEGWKIVIVKAS